MKQKNILPSSGRRGHTIWCRAFCASTLLISSVVFADHSEPAGIQINMEPPHEVETIVGHPHPLRLMFRHADHVVFGVAADTESVYYTRPHTPGELENAHMPNIVAFVRPQWLVASRAGDEREFARRLWRDHQGAPYILVACGNALRHLGAPPVQLHHDFPYLLFLSDSPKDQQADIYRIGGIAQECLEIFDASPENVFTPSVISWGTTYLGSAQQVVQHPEFQAALELYHRMFPKRDPLTDHEIRRRAELRLFSRQQLFGESTPEQILEAMVLFTEHVARERTLHLLDDLVRENPDNSALWFIGRDLHEENLLDYPVLTHLARPPQPPAEILEQYFVALDEVLGASEAKSAKTEKKSAREASEEQPE